MAGSEGFFVSFCMLSIFLLAGKILRVKIKLFQTLFLPSSIIAGFLALICGPFGFDLLATVTTDYWSKIPGILISVVFASLFLGVALPRPRALWEVGGPQLCYGVLVGFGQYFVALLVTWLVLSPLFGTPAIFACIVEIGFSGGHGTAAGMEQVFNKLGFPAGSALGQMSATVGIISAVVFGIVLINVAIRKGYCALLNEKAGIPTYKRIGLIPEPKRYSIATATVATEAIEPLTFHFAVISVAVLIGWLMLQGVEQIHFSLGGKYELDLAGFPLFPLAMIGGLVVQGAATVFKFTSYLDRDTFDRILGFALDILVISAIATIKLDLFLANLVPFLTVMVTGVAWVFVATVVIAPRMFPRYWFERGVTEYGMQTGVTAIGLLLLRLVDPAYKTDTATAFGFKQMVYEPFLGGGFITVTAPYLIAQFGPAKSAAFCALIMLLSIGVSYLNGWTRLRPTLRFEDAEQQQ